jgi:tetratricopeptide (TPR) repeat protein
MPDTHALKDFASTGQFTVQVQDIAGAPFFEGATVTVLTVDIATKLSMVADQSGRANFTALPVGQYVVEITAPGYRTVQEQVRITGAHEAHNITVSMVPAIGAGKAKAGSASVSAKAVKETEKALQALQLNSLDEAQRHLSNALTADPNFADGNYLMGLLLLRRKEPERAVAYLQKSLKVSADHPAALLALGEAQYLEHDYTDATASLEKFLVEQPRASQAPVAQKYVDAMRKFLEPRADSDSETLAVSSGSSPARSDNSKPASGAAEDDTSLPSLTEAGPLTKTSWAPPDVDTEKLDFDLSASCQLSQVTQSAGKRVEELVQNVDHFTATEQIEHLTLSPMGLQTSRETRRFNYLVEIRQVEKSDLDVREYRSGGFAGTDEFPGHIATMGLPTLALIFHPYLQARYDFLCEGRSSWKGRPAWVVRFQQRADHASSMLTYHVGDHYIAVGLKGRAWIDAQTFQVVAMESDILRPVPEIKLSRDHQLIEYGPVRFRDKSLELWLPKSADWYCSLNSHRFHRRHTFSQFLLFSVDDKQKISAPVEPTNSDNLH